MVYLPTGIDSDPRLHDLKVLVLELSTLHSSSSWKTDTTVVSKLNKPPLSNKPLPQMGLK